MIILDTDIVTLLQRAPTAVAEKLLDEVERQRRFQPVATTIITYEEQMRGWLRVLAEARTMKDQIEAYRRLHRHVEDFRLLTLVDFTEGAAVEFQRLRGMKVRIGTMDLRIASIVLAQGATLWSRNARDFQQVPALKIFNPLQ